MILELFTMVYYINNNDNNNNNNNNIVFIKRIFECETLLDKCAIIRYSEVAIKAYCKYFTVPINDNVFNFSIEFFNIVFFSYIKRKCLPKLRSCIAKCSHSIFCIYSFGSGGGGTPICGMTG